MLGRTGWTAELELRLGRPVELDPVTLYRILRLRVDVFVVEQACPYPELDGRDLEPGCRWLWAELDGRLRRHPAAARRGRRDGPDRPGGHRRIGPLGRRGRPDDGVRAGPVGRRTVLLDAQSYLAGLVPAVRFPPGGNEFVEDGIAHLPMRRDAQPA